MALVEIDAPNFVWVAADTRYKPDRVSPSINIIDNTSEMTLGKHLVQEMVT